MVKDRKAWHAAVYGVSKSQTWLRDWTTATKFKMLWLINSLNNVRFSTKLCNAVPIFYHALSIFRKCSNLWQHLNLFFAKMYALFFILFFNFIVLVLPYIKMWCFSWFLLCNIWLPWSSNLKFLTKAKREGVKFIFKIFSF